MSAEPKLNAKTITEISLRLLQPYTIRPDSPYLSKDQQLLSRMSLQERSEWMAEWLQWAQQPSRKFRNK